MKYLLIVFSALILSGTALAQALQNEKCSWRECELIPYIDDMSQELVVVGYQSIRTDRVITGFSELTDKEVKRIKKAMRRFNSCTAYVDYDHVLVNKELNPTLSDYDLTYMIVKEQKDE